MGLANMETRASEAGGRLTSTAGSPGTDVVLSVPLTHPAVLKAWVNAGACALLVLSYAVFYGIRGASSDLPTALVVLTLFAAWVVIRFAIAYFKAWRRKR